MDRTKKKKIQKNKKQQTKKKNTKKEMIQRIVGFIFDQRDVRSYANE